MNFIKASGFIKKHMAL